MSDSITRLNASPRAATTLSVSYAASLDTVYLVPNGPPSAEEHP